MYYWNDGGSHWTDLTDADGDGMYEAVVPAGYTNFIFCRMNPGTTANDWSNKWNQTSDLTLPTDGTNCYTMAEGTWDQGGGTWSTYTPEVEEEETTAPSEPEVTEPETITVYFRNDWLWPEVYVHYWNDSQGTAWPGEVMTFVETTDAGDVYTAEIPAWATALLFNGLENGNASNRQQTPDITSFADGDAFYIHWDGANAVSKFDYTPSNGEEETDPTDPPVVETTYIIAGTAALCGTAWDPANTANTMTLNADTGLYEKTYESVAAGTHSFKVTDGTWDNSWGGTGTDGNYEFTLDAISNVTITFNADTKAIAVTSEATGEVAESVEWATIHYRNTGLWTTVNGYAWYSGTSTTLLGGWPGTAITENADHPNWYTVELTDLAENAGIGILFNNGSSQTGDIMINSSGEYWYDGALLSEAPDSWEDGSVQNVEYEVTLHFANTLNWGSVNLYTWTAAGTPCGSWPGTACGLDSDGFYSLKVTYEAPENQGLNFIFNGGGVQTVDLALAASDFVAGKAEKWVVLTTTNDEGKYNADIVDSPDAIAVSPVVSGTSVTFAYKGATTDTVEVRGSFNDWADGYAMTCNEYGVFSVTLEDVGYGIHQYKFVVNGNWILDPINGFVVTDDDGNKNSAFLISNPELDTNTVTVNVHFDAPSAEWNVCAWGAPGLEAQYDFTDGVTTITLDGRASQYVAFKVRKSIEGNDWAEQSGEIRVGLGNIVSGTIDVYVSSDFTVSQSLNDDVVYANKISSVEFDYDNNTITIQTSQAVEDAETAFAVYQNGADAGIIDTITASGSTYTLTLTEELDLVTLYQYTLRFSEQVKFTDHDYVIGINTVYASDKFAAQYTYTGEDLGANWTADATTFVVWAPTAASVSVNQYESGTEGTEDLIESVAMEAIGDGAWKVTVDGISAMVLVQGENDPEHVHQWENGTCAGCGEVCTHSFVDGVCTACGMTCEHDWNEDYCPNCGTYCGHEWVDGTCSVCGMVCDHAAHWQNGLCSTCLTEVEHVYSENGLCSCGKSQCEHESHNVNGMCDDCGLAVGHTVGEDGICTVCSYNQNLTASLRGSMNSWDASANVLTSIGGTKVAGSIYLTAGTYEFKIFYNDGWYGNGGTINSAASGWVMDSDANCTLNAQYDGVYTFVYDTAANTLDVYSKITETLYLRGTFNEWGATDALALSGGDTQTITVTLEAGTYQFKVGNDDWTCGAPAADISITLDHKADLTVTAAYNGDGTWTVTYETVNVYDVVIVGAEGGYDTLEGALAAAKEGETVQLRSDCDAGYVLVYPGITLDLNGHELTAEYVVGFETAQISDTVGTGKLITGEQNVVLDEDNAMLPVYDGTGYLFTDVGFAIGQAEGYTGEGFKIAALVCPHNMDVVELLKDGAADNNIQIMIQLTWDTNDGTGSQKFVFKDAVVEKVFSSNEGEWYNYGQQFAMVITGFDEIENLQARVLVVSGTNAERLSNTTVDIT